LYVPRFPYTTLFRSIDAGQAVLLGDLLGAQVFFDRQGVIRAALDRGVVADDHAFGAGHATNAGDDAGARRGIVIDVMRGHRRELEEGRARIEQALDPFARQQLAAREVLGACRFAAAPGRARQLHAQVIDLGAHGLRVFLELRGPGVDSRFNDRHVFSWKKVPRPPGRDDAP